MPRSVLVPLVSALALAVPGTARARSELSVMRLVTSAPTAAAGTSVTVTASLRTRAAARRAAVTFRLSRDTRPTPDDVTLGSRTRKRLPARRTTDVRRTVTVPATVAAGRYEVLACVARSCAHRGLILTRTAPEPSATPSPVPASSPFPSPAPTAVPPASGPDPLTAPASARDVVTTPDASHAATATIGPAGGTLSATGADGSVYTLALPKDALLSPEPITLTPVTGVGGLPFTGGSAAAVDIAPDGLSLAREGTLTIVPAHAPDIADQHGFAWHDEDHEAYRVAPADRREITLGLEHFSGYGVASGAPEASWTPRRPLDRYRQASAELLERARAAELAGTPGDPDTGAKLKDIAIRAYDEVVKPQLLEASSDDRLATSAIQLATAWIRQVELLGFKDDARVAQREDEATGLIAAAIRNAYDRTYDRCMAGEPAYAPRLMALGRTAILLGIDVPNPVVRMHNCLRFELDVDATMTQHSALADFSENVHVARLPITVDLGSDGLRVTGTRPLAISDWSVQSTLPGCTAQPAGVTTDAFWVTDLQMKFNLFTHMDASGRQVDVILPPDRIRLSVNPGAPHEHYTFDQCGGGAPLAIDADLWSSDWTALNGPEHDMLRGWYTFDGLRVTGSASPWLQQTVDRTSFSASEHLVLSLDHTPSDQG